MRRAILPTWRMIRTRAKIMIKPKIRMTKQNTQTSAVVQTALSLHDPARNPVGTSRMQLRLCG
jgi:hypothetical protein